MLPGRVILVGTASGFALQRATNHLTCACVCPKHARMHLLSASDFTPARYPVALAADEIQLWLFTPDRRSGTSRGGDARVPALLGAYLGCAAAAVPLARGEHGKPFLAGVHALQFNVSHSGGALLVGIAEQQALGVDIESPRRTRPVLELARRFFAAGEAHALAQLDQAERQLAFLRLWSCKEAVVKALGDGIGFGLARLQFSLDARGNPHELIVIHASAGAPRDWHIMNLAPSTSHVGALAWRGPQRRVRAFVAAGD